MLKLLFVCIGNICRSPATEAIMNNLLEENGLSKQVTCDSVGLTTTFLGKPADDMMRKVGADRGYAITSISRPITSPDFEQADFILAMTDEILAELRLMAPDEIQAKKIYNITEFCEYHPDSEVLDPYCGDKEEFEFVVDILEDACNGLLAMVKKQIN